MCGPGKYAEILCMGEQEEVRGLWRRRAKKPLPHSAIPISRARHILC